MSTQMIGEPTQTCGCCGGGSTSTGGSLLEDLNQTHDSWTQFTPNHLSRLGRESAEISNFSLCLFLITYDDDFIDNDYWCFQIRFNAWQLSVAFWFATFSSSLVSELSDRTFQMLHVCKLYQLVSSTEFSCVGCHSVDAILHLADLPVATRWLYQFGKKRDSFCSLNGPLNG